MKSEQRNRYLQSSWIWFVVFIGIGFLGCSAPEKSDAYGQFEADVVRVSAEASGVLQNFGVKEGAYLEEGQVVGQIDSTALHLQKNELQASIRAILTNTDKLRAEKVIYKEQLETAQKELKRFTSLKKEQAATQQQIDQAQGEVNVLRKKIAAVEVQKESVQAEVEKLKTKQAQLEYQLTKTAVINAIEGVVLQKLAEQGELVATGKPLYEVANLQEMTLRVYVSGAQLPKVKLGDPVEVLIDKNAAKNEKLEGTVSWISSRAEFTPRMIQTKEERVTQVYAVKVTVKNEQGTLKIGMPGEVNF